MMDYYDLSKTILFRGTTPEEVETMLNCLGAERRQYAKGQMICRTGDIVSSLGIVLSGSVLVENDDLWGNSTILDRIGPGQIFAETYACTPGEPLMVNVVVPESAEVLFLQVGRILEMCPNACGYHNRLIRNLLTLSAQKNLTLSRKIFHTSSKSIRGRLRSYLSYQAILHGSRSFAIPFDRQQLADYLNVDRSALSNELSKMQKEGLLTVRKNHFTLNQENLESPFF